MDKKIAVVILAAGKSTRMKSDIPKVLHPICGRPMLEYVIDLVKALKAHSVLTVVGYKHQDVRKTIGLRTKTVIQKQLRGTADALKQALPFLKGFKGTVLVLYGDTPLLKIETVRKLLKQHIATGSDATLLTVTLEKPVGYGRVLRDQYGAICAVVEEKDADDFQKDIKEINTGIMCFKKEKLAEVLKQIKPNNRKKEYYLTDAIDLLYKKGGSIEGLKISDINETLGINSRVDLAKANSIMQERINEEFSKNGITIVDPRSTFIGFGAKIGQDTIIYPFTVIERGVRIGKRCSIGPFAHLRESSRLSDDVVAGNFLEIVRSSLSSKTLIKHFSYIGDSRIGRSVNIGAGTVVANFDGAKKNLTVIKDNAFIGSDTVLVAPVKIGKKGVTGAGTILLRNNNVPDGKVAVGVPGRIIKKTKR